MLWVFVSKTIAGSIIIREKWSLTISNDIDLLVMVRVPEQLPNTRAGARSGEGRGGRHGGVRHLQALLGSSAHRGQGGQQSVIITVKAGETWHV